MMRAEVLGQAQGRPCYCAAPGCQYVEQVSATPPGKDGVFQLTMQAADESCYTGQQGPFDLFVDRCGAVLTGASWHARSNATFNPQALDQEVDLLLLFLLPVGGRLRREQDLLRGR